jgi:membrane-bound metal-dependent hydrolase YbcI (DUF457 family)
MAHGLWVAAALAVARRGIAIKPVTARATIVASVAPDFLHAVPLVVWAVLTGHGGVGLLRDYALASPGQEPWVPEAVAFAGHHLHCAAHSAVVAAAVTLVAWLAAPTVLIALLGWWSHIVIDVFTHSADFYPAPVLYPLSDRTIDGLAWNRPELMVANYATLAIVWWWIARTRNVRATSSGGSATGAFTVPHQTER